jgi:hypothetical protein
LQHLAYSCQATASPAQSFLHIIVPLVFQQQQRRRSTTSTMDFLCFALHWLKNYSSLLLCNKWQFFQFFFLFFFFEERKEREPLEKWQQQQQQLKKMLCNRQLTILWRHKRIGFVLVIRLATHIDICLCECEILQLNNKVKEQDI